MQPRNDSHRHITSTSNSIPLSHSEILSSVIFHAHSASQLAKLLHSPQRHFHPSLSFPLPPTTYTIGIFTLTKPDPCHVASQNNLYYFGKFQLPVHLM